MSSPLARLIRTLPLLTVPLIPGMFSVTARFVPVTAVHDRVSPVAGAPGAIVAIPSDPPEMLSPTPPNPTLRLRFDRPNVVSDALSRRSVPLPVPSKSTSTTKVCNAKSALPLIRSNMLSPVSLPATASFSPRTVIGIATGGLRLAPGSTSAEPGV